MRHRHPQQAASIQQQLPPVTYTHLNSPSLSELAGHLDIGLFAPFSSSARGLHLYGAEGDNPAFSIVTNPLSSLTVLLMLWTDGWPSFGLVPTRDRRGSICFTSRDDSFLLPSTSRRRSSTDKGLVQRKCYRSGV